MLRAAPFTCACVFVAALSTSSHAQGVSGSGIASGVAGGISAGGLGGGGVASSGTGSGGLGGTGGGGLGGSGATGGGGQGGVGGSNAVQGLTGSRDTVLQSSGFMNQNALTEGGFMAAQGANTGQGGGGAARGAAAGGRGGNQFGNAGGFGTGGAGGRGGMQPQQQRSTRIIRTRLTIAPDFDYRAIPLPQVQAKLNSEFLKVSQLRPRYQTEPSAAAADIAIGLRGSRITATANGRTVVLQGQVATERDRQVAERMATMEPGVDSVVNELVVVAK